MNGTRKLIPNIYNALTEKRRTCTVVCMMLKQFKLMSSCWSRTKIKKKLTSISTWPKRML